MFAFFSLVAAAFINELFAGKKSCSHINHMLTRRHDEQQWIPGFNSRVHQVWVQVSFHVVCSLTHVLTFKTAVETEQQAECQRICYLIRSVLQHNTISEFNWACFASHSHWWCFYSRHWIQEFWMMFRLHHSLSDSLDEFRDLIREQGQERLCSLLETKWM